MENGDERGAPELVGTVACRCANARLTAAADGEISLVAKGKAVSGDLLKRNGRGGRADTVDGCDEAMLPSTG